MEGVLDFELGFEVRSASWMTGGWGERAARAWCDIEVGESGREAGKEDSEVLRDGQGPLAVTGAAFGGEVRWAAEEGGAAWAILDWAPGRGGGGEGGAPSREKGRTWFRVTKGSGARAAGALRSGPESGPRSVC